MYVEKVNADPKITERRCGGWLAVSREASPIKIGVTAPTEQQARSEFVKAMSEWQQLIASGVSTPVVGTEDGMNVSAARP